MIDFMMEFIKNALNKKGNYLVISPTFKRAKDSFYETKGIVPGQLIDSIMPLVIKFKNGSKITFKSSSPDEMNELRGSDYDQCVEYT